MIFWLRSRVSPCTSVDHEAADISLQLAGASSDHWNGLEGLSLIYPILVVWHFMNTAQGTIIQANKLSVKMKKMKSYISTSVTPHCKRICSNTIFPYTRQYTITNPMVQSGSSYKPPRLRFQSFSADCYLRRFACHSSTGRNLNPLVKWTRLRRSMPTSPPWRSRCSAP